MHAPTSACRQIGTRFTPPASALAHVIRYLDDAYAIDTDAQVWARQVADALRGAIPEVNTTRVDDQATPDAGLLTRLRPASTRGWRSGSPPTCPGPGPRATIPACNWPNGSSARPTKCGCSPPDSTFLPRTTLPRTTARSCQVPGFLETGLSCVGRLPGADLGWRGALPPRVIVLRRWSVSRSFGLAALGRSTLTPPARRKGGLGRRKGRDVVMVLMRRAAGAGAPARARPAGSGPVRRAAGAGCTSRHRRRPPVRGPQSPAMGPYSE